MKYALRLSYLGKNYCGWQRQSRNPEKKPLLPSIQEIVEAALSKMIGAETTVVSSGRTDAGVNSTAQIAHFWCENVKLTAEIFYRGLNSLLPMDVRVMEVHNVPDEFHAQRSAIKKQYSYYFQQGPCTLPQFMDSSFWISKTLDVTAMQTALSFLIGEHDFKVFQATGSKPEMATVRTILEAEVTREKMPDFPGQDLNDRGFSMVRVRVVGTGFLKQMVRGIAGTLLQIGENRRNPQEMAEILASKNRALVGPTAPAKGLTLERVWYKPDLYGNSN
jgi:tRNA pseudouridine38-40 synthase